ncbi:pirin family protein [Acetobacter indonesiensis]|uniref:pirin family protein n=1 Tax=Acetobacter indonesiensis TaxID=104101 RepID=UPI0020A2DE31|nr:pirin family protein [Acetobacter indonesiensis]MCP1229628.1 pirin family protein [Acetobacter indonesiensis]
MVGRRVTAHSGTQNGALRVECYLASVGGVCLADKSSPEIGAGRLKIANQIRLPSGADYAVGAEANVDILTWVCSGKVVSKNNSFCDEVLGAGSLHIIGAGRGLSHLAWNAQEKAVFFQFWILQDNEGGEPTQEVRPGFPELEDGSFKILASGFPEDDPEDGETCEDGSPLTLRSRSRFLHARLSAGDGAAYQTIPGQSLYLTVVSGCVTVGCQTLEAGDAFLQDDDSQLMVMAAQDAVVLLVDVPLDGACR